MRERKAALRGVFVVVAAAVVVACGHAEQRVVDQYFGAVNQGDDQTLASFAAVKFDKKVSILVDHRGGRGATCAR